MKKLLLLFSILSIFLITPSVKATEYKVPKVDNSEKVYDYADLLTEEEEKELYELSLDYIEKYKMDLVFVTINENPYGKTDRDISLYAEDFYEYSEFGVGNTHDGLIILIDMDNRAPCVTATGNAILIFDDVRKETMNDNAYNYLASGEYYEAFRSYNEDAVEYAKDGIPESNKYYCIDEDGEYYKCKSAPKSVNWLITIVVAILGSAIPVFIHTRKYRGIRLATDANSYLKSSTANKNVDQFLTTFTSTVRRSHDSGGSGHSGGGSSISHGSGGMSHSSSVGRHF